MLSKLLLFIRGASRERQNTWFSPKFIYKLLEDNSFHIQIQNLLLLFCFENNCVIGEIYLEK